ncbi:hypothetical protein LAZ67_9001316 [Cordylochernes scorpioides]|uniref:Integrase catalytic domain-containing protein n=1 Tax=Cordylochernes scorpioides TaxID=51811 RepID=A0ABY6KUX1_9ARAC|nr:hypothetical protein LAZ67_9001316 [Cordylochernes scorpioides]
MVYGAMGVKVKLGKMRKDLKNSKPNLIRLKMISMKFILRQLMREKHLVDTFQDCPLRTPVYLENQNLKPLTVFLRMEQILKQLPQVYQTYKDFMQEYLDLGHMNEVKENGNDHKAFYLPHHPKKKARPQNCELTQASKEIFPLLLRFRSHPIAISADITKMYRQIFVHPEDTPYQRIIWRDESGHGLKKYELKTLTFGTSCAPFLAIRVLKQLAHDEQIRFPTAEAILKSDFYKIAEIYKRKLDQLLQAGGFELRQWTSIKPTVLDKLQETDKSTFYANVDSENTLEINLLGINLNPKNDEIELRKFEIIKNAPTKRNILLQMAKIYDPLGWFAPVMLEIKLMIHACSARRLAWPLRKDDTQNQIETSFNRIIRCAQQEDYYIDLRQLEALQPLSGKSPLIKLNPFLDKGELLRAHYITQLVIRHYHDRVLHAGVQLTLSAIREKYWIPSGRCLVKQIMFKCIKCARFRTKLVQQLMGNLPTSRINWTRPFTKTGIDFTGSVIVKKSNLINAKCDKVYIALLTCIFSKSIHIELITNLTTETFLSALRRFIARRVGAYKDLIKLFNSNIHDFASSEEIKWNFIPPSSPHFGGLWEAGIKSVKYHLCRIVGKTKLTFEELTTVLTQIEACLNSKPLYPLTDDPEDVIALTAGHFLIGMPLTAVLSLVRESGSSLKGRWQLFEHIKTDFWKRWSCEFFLQNTEQTKIVVVSYPLIPKWLKPVDNIKIGTLVLLKEDNLPPLNWRMGRIN